MLPPLIRKAVGDAGFDLELGVDAEWTRIGVSGLPAAAWIVSARDGGLVALGASSVLREFERTTYTEVPLPAGAAGAIRCHTAAQLHQVLKRVRSLFGQLPPVPDERFAARLAAITSTEVETVVRQRVGQALFREMLMEYWDGCCAVTGLDVPELLRASHAKPWKDADDRERLDVYNGFLLAVHLDALFDAGLMTFTDDGTAVFSGRLSGDVLGALVPRPSVLRLRRVADGHRAYLAYHRRAVFQE